MVYINKDEINITECDCEFEFDYVRLILNDRLYTCEWDDIHMLEDLKNYEEIKHLL